MDLNDSDRAPLRRVRGYGENTGHGYRHEVLTQEQLWAQGRRRKDAEQKLERHLAEAHIKDSIPRSNGDSADPAGHRPRP